jgi:hypothetical protein
MRMDEELLLYDEQCARRDYIESRLKRGGAGPAVLDALGES